MNWLVTGGCGFIGTSLIHHLIKNNISINIRVLDNLTMGSKEDLSDIVEFTEILAKEITSSPEGVELVVGDIRDSETCMHCCKGIDIVVHFAASTGVPLSIEEPRFDMECNVIGTFNMLEGARKNSVKSFIFASSGASVGEVEPPIHEEKAPKPVSPYGASKLSGEAYCSAYSRSFGIRAVSLRFGNVYGPRSKHKNSVVAKFIKQALKGETLEVYGDGKQTRDYIYIDDLIDAIIHAAGVNVGGEVFQIATYRETTVNELADLLKELIKQETAKMVSIIHGQPRLGDVRRNFSDISKARMILGYEPKYDLKKGLAKTLRFFLRIMTD